MTTPVIHRRSLTCVFPLLLLLSAWGCQEGRTPGEGIANPVTIVPTRLTAGDQLAGMRIEAMDVTPENVDSTGWMGSVDFSGTVTLTGRYRPHPETPDVRALCFYPDSVSAAQLPRFPNDNRASWFCFANTDEAEVSLGSSGLEGEATIVINEFNYLYQHTDSYNSARLQQVLQRR